MTTRACPNCGEEASTDPLEAATTGTGWLHCGSCDHLWQEDNDGSDVFSLIVGNQATTARPQPGRRPAGEPKRALRFAVQLPARFRSVGETEWSRGTTVNVSQ